MITIRSFPDHTRERVARLSDYLVREVLNEGFVCRSHDQCRASCSRREFYEGQLHHVGQHFDLEIDGTPTRIIIVGQEYGTGPAQVSLEGRSEMIRASATKGFRGRNPHMQGTTTLLRLLFRRDPGDDDSNEQVLLERPFHIFEGFALVNYLLCSAIESLRDVRLDLVNFRGAARGLSTRTMRQNCKIHFRKVIEILDPTVIIAQGIGVRRWIGSAFELPFDRGPTDPNGIGRAHLLTFVHPSAPIQICWGRSLRSEYLRQTVVPTVTNLIARIQASR